METSDVRKRVRDLLEWSKKPADDRRANRRHRMDAAASEYEQFLRRVAVPLFKQVADALNAEGYRFTVFTPGGSVRLVPDRDGDTYIEVVLDTKGSSPKLLGRALRAHGGNVTETELVLNATADIGAITDDDLLGFVLSELEGFL